MSMAETSTPGSTDVRTRVEALFRALNEHDADKIIALHTPEAVWEDPDLTAPVKGRAAIAVRLATMFRAFSDLQYPMDEVEIYTAESGRVVARWHAVGTMTGPLDPPGFAATGKKVSITGACFYEFEDGLIARHTILYDTTGLLRQAGIMPASGSAPAKFAAGLQRAAVGIAKRGRRH